MQQSNKKLGFWMLTALVTGNIIGAGIFLIPSSLASIGSISIYSWIITTIGTFLLIYVFIDLNRMLPASGGPYLYAKEAFGPFTGFMVVYLYYLAWTVGIAGMAVVLTGYIGYFFPPLNENIPQMYSPAATFLVKIGVVWLLTLVNIIGIRNAGWFQLVSTILKVIPLLLIALFGWSHIDPHYFSKYYNISGHSNLNAISSALAITLWAYIGFESATIPSENTSGNKIIKRATYIGTLLAALLYILGSLSIMGSIPAETLQHSGSPYSELASLLLGGKAAGVLVSLSAVIAIIGAINGSILVQVHVASSAARDGLFPKFFTKKHRQGEVPTYSFIISAIIVTLFLLLTVHQELIKQFTFIVLLSSFAFLVAYFLSAAAKIVLIQRDKLLHNKPYPLRGALISLLALFYTFWAIIGSGQEAVYLGALLLFTAYPLYAFFTKDMFST